MGIFGKKGRGVPDELPDLICDENEDHDEVSVVKRSGVLVRDVSDEERKIKEAVDGAGIEEAVIEERKVVKDLVKKAERIPKKEVRDEIEVESGFFDGLSKELSEGFDDLETMRSLYDKKLSSFDLVDNMKSHWKEQQGSFLKGVGKGFREDILKKTVELKALERDWQKICFDLTEKEEEIREAEGELKGKLREFMEVCCKAGGADEKKG